MLEIEKIEYTYSKIKSVKLKMDKLSKPLWHTLEKGKAEYNLKVIDRFSPFESIACQWALSRVYSEMSQFIVPKRALALRTLAAELQTVLWNVDYIRKVLIAAKENTYRQHVYFLRDMLLDLQEMWMGARVLPQYLTVSGVERDLTVGIRSKLQKSLKLFEKEFMSLYQLIKEDRVLLQRIANIMPITRDLVTTLDLGGVLAFSCGISNESRWDSDYGIYRQIDRYSPPASLCSADAKARLLISLDWTRHTLININKLLQETPEGSFDLNEKLVHEPQHGYFVACVDAPSGPLYASYVYKKILLSSSSTRLKYFLEDLLVGEHVEDLDLAIASLGFEPEQGALV